MIYNDPLTCRNIKGSEKFRPVSACAKCTGGHVSLYFAQKNAFLQSMSSISFRKSLQLRQVYGCFVRQRAKYWEKLWKFRLTNKSIVSKVGLKRNVIDYSKFKYLFCSQLPEFPLYITSHLQSKA